MLVQFLKIAMIMSFIMVNTCSTDDDNINFNADAPIALEFKNKLVFESKKEFGGFKPLITQIVKEAIVKVNEKFLINNVTIVVREGHQNVIREVGIGGFNPNKDKVIMSINADFEQLEYSINNVLMPLLAHELHHAKRRREVGYGNTLFESMISEGMADHFSIELTGIEPPMWSSALNESELDIWKENARPIYWSTSYNHADWFFGTNDSIPRWTGYSVGFKMVHDYLIENPFASASNLVDKNANTFIQN